MTYFFVLVPLIGLIMAFFFALRTPPARNWLWESERAFLFFRSKRLAFTGSFCAEVAHYYEGEKGHAAHGQCDERIKPEGVLDAPRVGQ